MTNDDAHKQMHPQLLSGALLWEELLKKAGIPVVYTCVGRTDKVQIALYAQGRNDVLTINTYRALAGMAPFATGDPEAKRIVTWTLNSQHVTNWNDGNPNNDLSRAWDYAVGDPKHLSWDVKIDVNKNKLPDYIEAGRLAQSTGLLEAGVFWKKQDSPHIQCSVSILRHLGLI